MFKRCVELGLLMCFFTCGSVMNLTTYLLFGCLALIFVAAIVSAITGRDISSFERMRTTAPKRYLHMKRTLKFNGPLVALMCVVLMIGSPMAVSMGDATVSLAALAFAGSGIFLWLSMRWTRWAYS